MLQKTLVPSEDISNEVSKNSSQKEVTLGLL